MDDNTDTQIDIVANLSATSSTVTAVNNTVSTLVSAMRAAVQGAAVGGGATNLPPAVSASSANDLVLTSGAGVSVTSGQCTNNDLCGAASFAATLKQALQSV